MILEVYLLLYQEAVEFYAKVFHTEPPQFNRYGDTPPDPNYIMPEEAKNLIMHTRLVIDGSSVMFSDAFPSMPYVEGTNFSLAIVNKDLEGITRDVLEQMLWKCRRSIWYRVAV